MKDTTMLLRQVHPSFIHAGKVSSQVFRPTPKDEAKLSMYNGDKITPEAAFEHFTKKLGFASNGVLGLEKQECVEQNLAVIDDAFPFEEHCSLDFSGLPKKEVEKIAKVLKLRAEKRGWLFQA